jgi:hypothetical protein
VTIPQRLIVTLADRFRAVAAALTAAMRDIERPIFASPDPVP